MTHGHRTVKCKECDKTISNCRCMRKDKTIIYETCDQCKIAVFEKAIEAATETTEELKKIREGE